MLLDHSATTSERCQRLRVVIVRTAFIIEIVVEHINPRGNTDTGQQCDYEQNRVKNSALVPGNRTAKQNWQNHGEQELGASCHEVCAQCAGYAESINR